MNHTSGVFIFGGVADSLMTVSEKDMATPYHFRGVGRSLMVILIARAVICRPYGDS